MPATFSTASRRLFRRSRSVLKPHLSLNRKPKAVWSFGVQRQDWMIRTSEDEVAWGKNKEKGNFGFDVLVCQVCAQSCG